MKTLLVTLITLTVFTTSVAQSKSIGTSKFAKRQGSHKVSVIFRTRAFDPLKHKVMRDGNYQKLIDGRFAHGTDGNIPNIEIAQIKLLLDGRDIPISGNLYSDCFEPNLNASYLVIRFGRKFQSVIIRMSGSDGAGSYEVVWRFRKNGSHSRFFRQGF